MKGTLWKVGATAKHRLVQLANSPASFQGRRKGGDRVGEERERLDTR